MLELETIKKCAEIEVQTLSEMRQLILDQHSSGFKWLNASLLAINGGGLISIFSSNALSLHYKRAACISLLIGILFALISGRLGQTFSLRGILPLQRWSGYWIGVSLSGSRDEEIETALAVESQNAIRWAWVGQACGWASVGTFVVAAIFAGLGLK
jgi:hypothetical protein